MKLRPRLRETFSDKFFKMGQKGQEFSVFKLLISAIIALAILAVLMPIIGGIVGGGFGADPNEEAVSQITNLYNKPSLHQLTKTVIFKQGTALNAKAIAVGTKLLTQDQLWLGRGTFSTGTDFSEPASTGVISYKGSGSKSVKLSILCDAGSAIDVDLTRNELPTPDSVRSDACSNEETCCVIILRPA